MKIGDVKIGEVYAYREHGHGQPGPVRAEEIVLQEDRPGSRYRAARATRQVRVTFLADYGWSSWSHVAKGTTQTVKALRLEGPWSDFAAKVSDDRREEAERAAVAAYLSSLLPECIDVEPSNYDYRLIVDRDHEAAQLDLAKHAGFYTEPESFALEGKS